MPVQKIRGLSLAYDDLGTGTAIVFVHGHPFNRSMWKYQADPFATAYRLLMPDLRGYGETGTAAGPAPYRTLLDEMALDIIHLLDELEIDQAICCGLSMGGQIVLDLYRLFPSRVKAIVIADSDARGESTDSYQRRLLLADTIIKDGMKKHTDDTIHQYIAERSLSNKAMYDHLYEMMSSTHPEGAAAAHRGRAERRDHTGLLPKIKVPALVVVGEEDYFTPIPVAKIMSDTIPGAELAVIKGTGHLPNMEAPEEFNAVLQSFLQENNL
jgi:pimeloyl-ACP methyl ester carboxylesterase